jgi:mono/diheme cytochrome c family protein
MTMNSAPDLRQPFIAYMTIMLLAITILACSQQVDPSFKQGKKLYGIYCAACHGINGEGVLYGKSVLNNSALVLGKPQEVISVILLGRTGAGTMPGWTPTLNDQEVAAVTTYIRQAWSNQAAAVTPQMVAEVREKAVKPPAKPLP